MPNDFADAKKWKLISPFVISLGSIAGKETRMSSAPKLLEIEVNRFSVRHSVDWDGEKKEYNYHRYIEFSGRFSKEVTVFNTQDGVLQTFREIHNCRIMPTEKGIIGGKHNSDVTSHLDEDDEPPENGYMEGEPSRLVYVDHDLYAEFFIEEEHFATLAERISNSDKITGFDIRFLGELFKRNYYSDDYGLLARSSSEDRFGRARARIEDINVEELEKSVITQDKDELTHDYSSTPPASASLRYQKYTLYAVLLLIVAELFSQSRYPSF